MKTIIINSGKVNDCISTYYLWPMEKDYVCERCCLFGGEPLTKTKYKVAIKSDSGVHACTISELKNHLLDCAAEKLIEMGIIEEEKSWGSGYTAGEKY